MMRPETEMDSSTDPGRRRLIAGSVAAGIGALLASQVACRPREPVPTPQASMETAPTPPPRATASNVTAATSTSTPSALPVEELKLRHLLRRAGFGGSPADLAKYRALGVNGAVDQLVDYEKTANQDLEKRLTELKIDLTKRNEIQRWWLLRMIYTARPLEEKMTLFWHGLLTSAISKVGYPQIMLVQNQFLRTNALGRFPDLLKGITRDPAMMIWLDTADNRKGHANENYARELMELFSLGVGQYTEEDVRESARAFTGLILKGDRKLGQAQSAFAPRLHDDGLKTFLGHAGNFNADDVIDIITALPASAQFITRKLFSFFVYPDPTDEVLAPFVETYRSHDYSIRELMRALLKSDAFYSPRAQRALVKSPAELVAGTARLLEVTTDGKALPAMTLHMGQELFNPPNVAGWPGGPAWLTSGTWLARLNFANLVMTYVFDPHRPSRGVVQGLGSASDSLTLLDRLVNTLLDGQLAPAQDQILREYLTPPTGDLEHAPAAWRDEHQRGSLYLLQALPEFHLA